MWLVWPQKLWHYFIPSKGCCCHSDFNQCYATALLVVATFTMQWATRTHMHTSHTVVCSSMAQNNSVYPHYACGVKYICIHKIGWQIGIILMVKSSALTLWLLHNVGYPPPTPLPSRVEIRELIFSISPLLINLSIPLQSHSTETSHLRSVSGHKDVPVALQLI